MDANPDILLGEEGNGDEPSLRESPALDVPWRCFHCDETFADKQSAAEHFGTEWFCEMDPPACIQMLTEGEKAIVNERREACRLVRVAEEKLDQAEHLLFSHEWEIRGHWPRLRTIKDVWWEYERVEGIAQAAEAALQAAPRWLARLLRRRAERLGIVPPLARKDGSSPKTNEVSQ